MTIELFHLDPYCSDFDAQILSVHDDYVVLDQTCFFPKSVDQASDLGRIEDRRVTGVRRVGHEIQHVLENDGGPLAVGDIVGCQVDWGRRYRIMRLHTAQHLMHVGFQATHDGATHVGGSVGPARATVKLDPNGARDSLEVEAVQRWVDIVVREGLVVVHEPDRSLDCRRHWHIDGLASVPCEGTHVRSTAEVGCIVIGVRDGTDDLIELWAELAAS